MLEVYGISNCDTVKKAVGWLKKNNVRYRFHDFKTEGISTEKLQSWINSAGIQKVLNKNSTTWKNLPADKQDKAGNNRDAIKLMQEQTSIIKRPVVEFGNEVMTGFSEEAYTKYL